MPQGIGTELLLNRLMLGKVVMSALAVASLAACGANQGPQKAPVEANTLASQTCAGLRLGNGLELVVLGSGGPRSAGRAAASYLVAVQGAPRLLIDVGPGSFVRLGESGLPADKLDTVLLTHLHVDHAGDVPGFVKSRDLMADEALTLQVFGPVGRGDYPSTTVFIDRLFGPQGAFAYLPAFRNPLRFDVTDLPVDLETPPSVVLEQDGLRVLAAAVDHADVPALAYRVEYAQHSIVVSGDLASRRGRVTELAKGADILVYDAAVLDPPGSPEPLYKLHTPPKRIGEVAATAGVSVLILSHLPPASESEKDAILASVRAAFKGDVRFAQDCLQISARTSAPRAQRSG